MKTKIIIKGIKKVIIKFTLRNTAGGKSLKNVPYIPYFPPKIILIKKDVGIKVDKNTVSPTLIENINSPCKHKG
tara:strand:- start:2290 stop:2511 length:222 start_codon:yes stop_codon:yes gene_type:complete